MIVNFFVFYKFLASTYAYFNSTPPHGPSHQDKKVKEVCQSFTMKKAQDFTFWYTQLSRS